MNAALAKTFEILTKTANLNAVDALVPGLESAHEQIQSLAVAALVNRDSTRGQVEVIRRLRSLAPPARADAEKSVSRMENALRSCLIHGDKDLSSNALELVRSTESYKHVPELLQLLKREESEHYDLAVQTLRGLVDSLYEHAQFSGGSRGRGHSNVVQAKQLVLSHFVKAGTEASLSPVLRKQLIESILILGTADNFAVKTILFQSRPECRDLAGSLLLSSTHCGVMQLILDFMSQDRPNVKALRAIQDRDDPEFICHLLRWFPRKLKRVQAKNFKQIERLKWLDFADPALTAVPPGLQEPLVAFINATGLSDEKKMAIQEWIVRHGDPEGRLAASSVLQSLDKVAVQKIVFDGLEDEDPEVQAWATSQLRSQHFPETFSLLIEQLDSRLDVVRDTARDELASFNLACLLKMFDELPPKVCRRAGDLIQKIEPDCIEKLDRELANPICRRRIRAARAALAMGLHEQVFNSLAALLNDDDTLVRRTAADVLGHVAMPESVEVLRRVAADDDSDRVRKTAEESLEQLREEMSQAVSH